MKRTPEKNGDGRQSIELLQTRFQSLNTRKIQAETHLENARKELDRLQREAKEKYGTDDVDALRKILEQMKSDNEEKRSNYQADLDRIETELTEIETKYDAAGASGESA